jgi:hypothetical protein
LGEILAQPRRRPPFHAELNRIPLFDFWIGAFEFFPESKKARVLPREIPRFNKRLNYSYNNTVMRVAMAIVFALLILNFADEHFNSARYTRATMSMLSDIARSFS